MLKKNVNFQFQKHVEFHLGVGHVGAKGHPSSSDHLDKRALSTVALTTLPGKHSHWGEKDVWVPAPPAPAPLSQALLPHLHLLLHLLPSLLSLLEALLRLLVGPRSAANPHRDHPEEPDHRLLGGNQPSGQCANSPRPGSRKVSCISKLTRSRNETVLLTGWGS